MADVTSTTPTSSDVTAFVQSLRTYHETLPTEQQSMLTRILETARSSSSNSTGNEVTGYSMDTIWTGLESLLTSSSSTSSTTSTSTSTT